jgi:hypothetical protein
MLRKLCTNSDTTVDVSSFSLDLGFVVADLRLLELPLSLQH